MKFLYKIVSYKTSICQLLRVTDSNTDYRAFIKRAIRAQTRGERARGSSPDSRPTPHAARGRVSTLLACWRLFSLRDCGEAARESLGGNLRVEGREETVSIVYSHPHLTGKASCLERTSIFRQRGGAPTENGAGMGWARPQRTEPARECVQLEEPGSGSPSIPHVLPCLRSPLSGGPHPSGSLRSF